MIFESGISPEGVGIDISSSESSGSLVDLSLESSLADGSRAPVRVIYGKGLFSGSTVFCFETVIIFSNKSAVSVDLK